MDKVLTSSTDLPPVETTVVANLNDLSLQAKPKDPQSAFLFSLGTTE
jgi:hypothetical protein